MPPQRKRKRGQIASASRAPRTDAVGQPIPSGATGAEKASEETTAPPAVVAKVQVKINVSPEAHIISNGQFLRLKPKPSSEPTILVWISEQGIYQPVFINPGGDWLLIDEKTHAEAREQAEARPRIINPFER